MKAIWRAIMYGTYLSITAIPLTFSFVGCARDALSAPPLVANPVEPWQAEMERGMLRAEATTPTPVVERWEASDGVSISEEYAGEACATERRAAEKDGSEKHGSQKYGSQKHGSQKHGAAQTLLADILGFPFRAVGWLAGVLL